MTDKRLAQLFRVFLSSTFKDWIAEREHLRSKVFPVLAEWVEAESHRHGLNARFLPIDLRWGVSEADQQDRRTVDVCLDEIRYCQQLTPRPNFLVFIGQRYGWRPVLVRIPESVWDKLHETLGTDALKSALKQNYRRDDNAIPPEYILREDVGEEGEKQLRSLLDEAWQKNETHWRDQLSRQERISLIGSVTEMEILQGLQDPHAHGHIHVFMRHIKQVASDDFVEQDEVGKALLQELNDFLADQQEKGLIVLHQFDRDIEQADEAWLQIFGRAVEDALKGVIEQTMTELPAEMDDGDDQIAPDTRYFHGYDWELTRLTRSDANGPMLLFGPPGMGKSTLMARVVEQLRGQDRPVIALWAGREPACATGEGVMRTLLERLRQQGLFADFKWEALFDQSFGEMAAMLEALALWAQEHAPENWRRLRILIDAIDQLPENDPIHELDNWLNETLPVTLSTLDDVHREKFATHFGASAIIELEGLTRQEGEQILSDRLRDAGRTLQSAQREAILDAFEQSGNPLHLQLLTQRALGWHAFDDPAVFNNLPISTRQAIEQLYDQWRRDYGAVLTDRVLSLLTASRFGLSETELMALFQKHPAVLEEFRRRHPESPEAETLPEVTWSRLYRAMRPYLTLRQIQQELLMDFLHRDFRKNVIENKFFLIEKAKIDIANIFFAKYEEWKYEKEYKNLLEPRILEELPVILYQIKSDNLIELCNDNGFLSEQMRYKANLPKSTLLQGLKISINKKDKNTLIDLAFKRTIVVRNSLVRIIDDLDCESLPVECAAGCLIVLAWKLAIQHSSATSVEKVVNKIANDDILGAEINNFDPAPFILSDLVFNLKVIGIDIVKGMPDLVKMRFCEIYASKFLQENQESIKRIEDVALSIRDYDIFCKAIRVVCLSLAYTNISKAKKLALSLRGKHYVQSDSLLSDLALEVCQYDWEAALDISESIIDEYTKIDTVSKIAILISNLDVSIAENIINNFIKNKKKEDDENNIESDEYNYLVAWQVLDYIKNKKGFSGFKRLKEKTSCLEEAENQNEFLLNMIDLKEGLKDHCQKRVIFKNRSSNCSADDFFCDLSDIDRWVKEFLDLVSISSNKIVSVSKDVFDEFEGIILLLFECRNTVSSRHCLEEDEIVSQIENLFNRLPLPQHDINRMLRKIKYERQGADDVVAELFGEPRSCLFDKLLTYVLDVLFMFYIDDDMVKSLSFVLKKPAYKKYLIRSAFVHYLVNRSLIKTARYISNVLGDSLEANFALTNILILNQLMGFDENSANRNMLTYSVKEYVCLAIENVDNRLISYLHDSDDLYICFSKSEDLVRSFLTLLVLLRDYSSLLEIVRRIKKLGPLVGAYLNLFIDSMTIAFRLRRNYVDGYAACLLLSVLIDFGRLDEYIGDKRLEMIVCYINLDDFYDFLSNSNNLDYISSTEQRAEFLEKILGHGFKG